MKDRDAEKLRLALLRMSPSRKDLLYRFTGGCPEASDIQVVSRFLEALCGTIQSRRRTELRGLGVFEWKPTRGRLPTGRRYNSWRMVFKFNQKRRKFNGSR